MHNLALGVECCLKQECSDDGLRDGLQDAKAISDDTIQSAKIVIADGNLSPRTIGELFKRSERLKVDTWFEPTSVQKAIRVVEAQAVPFMTYLSPNGDELEAISEAIKDKSRAEGQSVVDHERFTLSSEARILPEERMLQLKNDMITGAMCS